MDDRIQALDAEVGRWPAKLRSLPTVEEYRSRDAGWRAAAHEATALLLRQVKGVRKEIEDTFDPMQRAAHSAWQEVLRQRHRIEDPLEEAEERAKKLFGAYEAHEENLRREEEARLREIARKAEENARLAEAEMLERAGEGALAEALLEAPAVVPSPVAPRAVPKAEGTSTRTRWVGEVTDLLALAGAVVAGKAPLSFLKVDQSAVNGYVRGLRGAVSVPGLRAVEQRDVSVRA